MKLIVFDIEILLNEVGTNIPTNIYKTALGGFVAQFYNGIENILKRIHKHFNIDLPKGEDWHITLLDRFSMDSDLNFPMKLSNDLIEKITDYRRFRHYFFHGYSHNLNWEILKNGVKDIKNVLNQFIKEIESSDLELNF
jgi:hypothetical protein